MDIPTSLRILVVEDDAGDVLLLKEALKHAYSHFEFLHVKTVAEAADTLHRYRPDVVILDLSLPDGVGVEVVHKMHACAMQIPIVVLTGRDDEAMALICLHAGAQEFLSKSSLKSVALRRSIAYALSRQRDSSAPNIAFDLGCYQGILSDLERGASNHAIVATLRTTDAHRYGALTQEFRSLYALYLNQLIVKKEKPWLEMSNFISTLTSLGGGAADLIDFQINALCPSAGKMLGSDSGAATVERGQEMENYSTKALALFGLELMTLLAVACQQKTSTG